jgi:hypothetical protein
MEQRNRENKNPLPLSRQEILHQKLQRKKLSKKNVPKDNSWTILDHSPLPPILEILLNQV